MKVQRLLLVSAALAIVASYSRAAPAEIFLSLQEGNNTASANDTATPGTALYNGTIGDFTTTISVGLGYPAIGAPNDAILDLTSADLTTGTNGGTLTIKLSETGFTTTAATTEFLSRVTGNYVGANAVMDSYYDPSDAAFGTTDVLAQGLTDNQSATIFAPPITGPYSLTEIFTITAGANSLTSLDGAIIDTPEPGSLSLFGAALLVLGALAGRRAIIARSLPAA